METLVESVFEIEVEDIFAPTETPLDTKLENMLSIAYNLWKLWPETLLNPALYQISPHHA
jgi:hypothetical protein